jgi:hypothetical protein
MAPDKLGPKTIANPIITANMACKLFGNDGSMAVSGYLASVLHYEINR